MSLYQAGSLFADTLPSEGVTAKDASRYQEYLSNTSHQREMADLKAAGLNPILAANSGASTPSGQVDSGEVLQILNGAIQELGSTAKSLASGSAFDKLSWATVLKAFGVKSSQASAIGESLEAFGLTPGVVAGWTKKQFTDWMLSPSSGESSKSLSFQASSPLSDTSYRREVGYTGMMTRNGNREFYVNGHRVSESRYLSYVAALEKSEDKKAEKRYASTQRKAFVGDTSHGGKY